ncbi:MAG: hypothetical protein KC656_30465, partial [Myxococcales bacterium]|nr:hypothetical protein [Myxococcales bacterium]
AVTSLGNIARAWTGTGRQLLETAEEDWTPRIRGLSAPERQEAHLIVRRAVTSKKLKDRVAALGKAWDAT